MIDGGPRATATAIGLGEGGGRGKAQRHPQVVGQSHPTPKRTARPAARATGSTIATPGRRTEPPPPRQNIFFFEKLQNKKYPTRFLDRLDDALWCRRTERRRRRQVATAVSSPPFSPLHACLPYVAIGLTGQLQTGQ